jgi:uncharacterized protein (TIGR02246 family)
MKDSVLAELVSLERSALDRWNKMDPSGYMDLYTPEATYFDPATERRVIGLEALRALFAPRKNLKLPYASTRYEMIEPTVQLHGDVAVLTFNLVNYGTLANQPERVVVRWNSTEVYTRVDGRWRLIHSHWSFIKPELRHADPQI